MIWIVAVGYDVLPEALLISAQNATGPQEGICAACVDGR